jgi:hypothetical protein
MFCKAAPDPDLIAALRASLPTQPNDVTEADRKLVRAAVYGGREDRPSIERIQISLEEITVRVLALLSSQREEQVRELIDRIIGTLKSYPDGGGDVGIMAEVDRLLREQREADCRAVRALIEHDPTTCAYDPCGQCEHVGGLFDAEAAIRSLSLPEPPATLDRSNRASTAARANAHATRATAIGAGPSRPRGREGEGNYDGLRARLRVADVVGSPEAGVRQDAT